MATKSVVKTVLATTAVSVALCCSSPSEGSLLPSINYPKFVESPSEIKQWTESFTQPYTISENIHIDYNQIEVLHKFALNVLKNSKDLNPQYADYINENLFKLI